MSNDSGFHNKYRPESLARLIGNERARSQMRGIIESDKYPSAILFTGPPGAGKTTIARAFVNDVLENENVAENLEEWNFGDKRSIEEVRGLIPILRLRPAHGAKRRFLLGDEVHALLANKPAADAFLKPLEEPVKSTTVLLCSMEPDKFNSSVTGRAILTRCVHVPLKAPSEEELRKQAIRIMKGEEMREYMSEEAIARVIEVTVASGSSFRVLANMLESAAGYYSGMAKKAQLGADDIESALTTGTDDDVVAVRYLIALYNKKYVAAHREILSVNEAFGFVGKVIWLNWFVHNQVVLKEQRHPKVWGNKNSIALWNEVKPLLNGMDRAKAVDMMGTITSSFTNLKFATGAFAVDERILLSSKTYELINQLGA